MYYGSADILKQDISLLATIKKYGLIAVSNDLF